MRWILRPLYRVGVLVTSARAVVMGWSMYPTLVAGEYVLFDRLAYVRGRPRRGEVVLARGSQMGNRTIIKRVVGVPGDTVTIHQGTVMVNGVSTESPSSPANVDSGEHGQWTLREDDFFLLGDATDISTDSRAFGPVSRRAIKARAWLVYWPVSRWRRLDLE